MDHFSPNFLCCRSFFLRVSSCFSVVDFVRSALLPSGFRICCAQGMAPELLIPEIRAGDKIWKCKVLVLEKGNIMSPKPSKRLQKMVLADSEGNKVQGILWDGFIELYKDTLSVFNTYYVAGASVSPIEDRYLKNSPGMTMQWSIGKPTFIKPVTSEEERIPYPKIPYMSCTEMLNTVGTDRRVDLFAVVLDVKPPREKTKGGRTLLLQECTILQQELRPITLTLWENFVKRQGAELLDLKDEYPILLARGLMASTFTGLDLGTTPATMIAINPDVAQASEFQKWVSDHMIVIKNTERTPSRETFKSLLAYSPDEPVVRLADINPNGKNPWVKIHLTVDRTRQELTYSACPKCLCLITADPGESYYCFYCGGNRIAEMRCKLNVTITDDSDSIRVTMFDKLVEELLGKTTKELGALNTEEAQVLLKETNKRYEDLELHVQLRPQRKDTADNATKYTIQQIHFSSDAGTSTGNKLQDTNPPKQGEATDSEAKALAAHAAQEHADTSGKKSAQLRSETDAQKNSSTANAAPISPLKKMKVNDS